jgi:putative inorganic carbon (hco3(-)) transporter
LSTVVNVFLCVLALSPLPLGANRPWAWLIISGICFLILFAWGLFYLRGIVSTPRSFQTSSARLAIGLFFCSTLWGAAQYMSVSAPWLINLPIPTSGLYFKAADIILPNINPDAIPLTIDSSITAGITLRSVAYFCFYLLLLLLIDSRSRLRKLCYVIVVSGLIQAVYGSFMALSGIEYLLGIKKETYLGNATGTFISRNHFAGYLEMALATGIGLMMIRNNTSQETARGWRGRSRALLSLVLSGKAILRLMLIAMVIGLILSHSRMGNAAFFNSLLITGFISIALSAAYRKPRVYVLLVSIIAIDIILLGGWFGLEKVVQRIEQTSITAEERYDVNQGLLPMIEDYKWIGSGAGTFRYAFPPYVNGNYGGYDHAHNDYLEFLGELGYVGCSLLAGLVTISMWQALKALRHRHSSFIRGMGFAGFMRTLSLLIHSSVDFNLQIPANAMLFIAMLAIPTIALSVDKKTSYVK